MAAGRKRKSGNRYPSGKLIRDLDPQGTAAWPRLRDAAKKRVLDPVFGSELGRIYYLGSISTPQFDAGRKWERLVRAYDRAISAPARAAKISRYNDVPLSAPDVQSPRDNAIIAAFVEAHNVLHQRGQNVYRQLNRLCLEDQHLVLDEREAALDGLNALVTLWGLTLRA